MSDKRLCLVTEDSRHVEDFGQILMLTQQDRANLQVTVGHVIPAQVTPLTKGNSLYLTLTLLL